jgi:hypothetical protein
MNINPDNSKPKVVFFLELPSVSINLNNLQYQQLIALQQYFFMWELSWKVNMNYQLK